jgi:hypothetical protein
MIKFNKLNTDLSNNHKLNVDNLGNIKLSSVEILSGLSGTRYVGYHDDNPLWFTTATPHGDTNTLTSIDNFSSSPDFSSEDYYSWQWLGYFKPSSSEIYTFYTNSDDGSYLWIGGGANNPTTANALVNNGGAHGPQEISGTISLMANTYYPIRIQFGELGGGDFITVSFSTDTISKTTNGSGYYFH